MFGYLFVFLFFVAVFLLWDNAPFIALPLMFVSMAGLSFYSFAIHSTPLAAFFSICCVLFVLTFWVLTCREGREL